MRGNLFNCRGLVVGATGGCRLASFGDSPALAWIFADDGGGAFHGACLRFFVPALKRKAAT